MVNSNEVISPIITVSEDLIDPDSPFLLNVDKKEMGEFLTTQLKMSSEEIGRLTVKLNAKGGSSFNLFNNTISLGLTSFLKDLIKSRKSSDEVSQRIFYFFGHEAKHAADSKRYRMLPLINALVYPAISLISYNLIEKWLDFLSRPNNIFSNWETDPAILIGVGLYSIAAGFVFGYEISPMEIRARGFQKELTKDPSQKSFFHLSKK